MTAAVTLAETRTDAEIVTIVADRSDAYHDVVLHWALLAALLVMAVAAAWPHWLYALRGLVDGGWTAGDHPVGQILAVLLVVTVATFLAARYLFGITPIRMALTPGTTRSRRVRRRALELFRVGIEAHTASRTGVLLYLSMAEHRAEIVADAAVHALVPPDRWGDAMALLLDAVRDGRAADGMVAAVEAIGAILATHFPATGDDPQELPDRLIQL